MEEIKIEKFENLRLFLGRYRSLFSLLLAIVILFLGYSLILNKPLKNYRDSLDLMGKLDTDLLTAESQLAQAQAFSTKLYQISTDDKRILDMALPTKPDFSALIENISSMAERSGFVVNNIDLEDSNGRTTKNNLSSNIGKVSIRLKLSGGDYANLRRFVDLTESSVMMMDIYAINFSSKNPVYDISLLVYYYLTD